MKRLVFLILILAVTARPGMANEQTHTVEVKNETQSCYTVDVTGLVDGREHFDIGITHIDSGHSYRFTYTYSGRTVELRVFADACDRLLKNGRPALTHHGINGGAPDARMHEVFRIVQTSSGRSADIIRSP